MKTKKISKVGIIRVVIQIISFILIPGLFISTFSSIKAIYMSIIGGTFDFGGLLPQMMLVTAVLPMTLLFGRFFCGYLCAFGSIQDLLGFVSRKLFKNKPVVGEKVDKVLKLFKYAILLFFVIFIWTLGTVSFENSLNPWNIFGMYATFAGWSDLSGLITVGFVLLVLIMIASMIIERFFCRYLCPLGAIFTILSKLRIIHVKKESTGCGACRQCTKSCPMGIPMYRSEKITSGECVNCFKCTAACPKNNLKAEIAGKDMAPAAAGLITTAAMMGIYYVGNIISDNSADSLSGLTQMSYGDTLNQGQYSDGDYTGSADGYRGTTTVQVTVQNGFITDIEVISTGDDAQFFNLSKSAVISDIISSQSTEVSAVTGATYSSNSIMNAVADALDIHFSVSTDESAVSSEPTAEQSSAETNSEPVVSANDTDGVYSGSGTGYRGEITVSVVVSGGLITVIDIQSYQDDREYFERASDTVAEQIINTQSVEVDAVSGATFSSNGIMEAVADALGVEFTNPNSSLTQEGHGGGHH